MLQIQQAGNYWCVFYGKHFVTSYHSRESAEAALEKFERRTVDRIRKILLTQSTQEA